MRLFMLGDFTGTTGPGIANKTIKDALKNKKNITYSLGTNKFIRIVEMVFKIIFAEQVCICSFSKSNIYAVKIANMLNKKTYYIMHGYSTYEKKTNYSNLSNEQIKIVNDFEKKIFKNVDKVFCVSELFMKQMQVWEPEYKDKFSFNYTGIDISIIEEKISNNKIRKDKQIVSIGGGMPQKNNLEICRAIEKLNNEKKMDLSYIVIGANTIQKKEIEQYEFVSYIDKMPHEKVLKILSESNLYIQNSDFETFGISIIEALLSGCNLLISNNIGSREVINTVESSDLIYNPSNTTEIANKIENILKNNNSKRLREGLSIEKIHHKNAAQSLIKKIKS